MRLGKLIEVLARLPPTMPVGLGRAISYRGFYEQLAFAPDTSKTAAEALTEARSAVGRTFGGYKGGDYTMDEDTHCWVAKYGEIGEPIGEHMVLLLLNWLEESRYGAR